MATTTGVFAGIDDNEYRRRIRAWTMYDWANSAFATTILAAVLPVYYSQVAGATLPSASTATAYWSTGLSVSLFIVGIFAPILGTISDVMRGKKRFLAVFFGLGTVATGLLVLVDTGDWLLASILFILGRIGFAGANVFYDALLPHIAKEEDLDIVSTRGYAMGYLGGGLLLAINIVMIQYIPGTWGARLSFLSVGLWWLVFSIPLFLRIPEPPAATARLEPGETIVSVSFRRLVNTFRDIRQYSELFKFLLAFLIYIDGVGTIIGVAAIYGAELGFGSLELILALLLVQFVGIPYSLIFGRLPSKNEARRPFYLAFVLFNLIALPLAGISAARLLPSEISGTPLPAYAAADGAVGEGTTFAGDPALATQGGWEFETILASESGTDSDTQYAVADHPGARMDLLYIGQNLEMIYSSGPQSGVIEVELDGEPLLDRSGQAVTLDAYNATTRYGVRSTIEAPEPGRHTLSLIVSERGNPNSKGTRVAISSLTVLPPLRQSNLGVIIGMIFAVQLIGLALAYFLGPALFANAATTLDTKRSILLALLVYTAIALWGYFLNSVVEFWFLAWMVAVVQGGSQALSRSMFSMLSPAAKSGEFFGLFGIMEKFSAIVGPLVFAFAATTFNSSRPAVLSIVAFFIVGGYLLTRVDVAAGRQVAQAEDAAYLSGVGAQ